MNEEKITSIHHVRGSTILLSARLFFALFFIDTAYAIILAFLLYYQTSTTDHSLMLSVLWIIHSIKFVIISFFALGMVLPWMSTVYYISDHFLVSFFGVWRKHEETYDLHNIRSVSLHETWVGKMLNYGDVSLVIAASGYRQDIRIRGITDPRKYERIFREYLNQSNHNIITPHK